MPRTPREPKPPATTRFTQAIAEELRAAKARENRSQRWLGDVIGRDQTYAGRVINGYTAPTTDELVLLCIALHVPILDLVERAERNHDDPAWQPKVPGVA